MREERIKETEAVVMEQRKASATMRQERLFTVWDLEMKEMKEKLIQQKQEDAAIAKRHAEYLEDI